jgi:pimeloyl-ACP methyl ester carboxylesterase
MRRLFVPGLGASPALYARALDRRWRVLSTPTFAESNGSIRAHVAALVSELDSAPEPAIVAGHSMGAAVAVLATLERPEAVARLVLVAPAGLPLTKPIRRSLRALAAQLWSGCYPLPATLATVTSVIRAPRSAARLVMEVRSLDLTCELGGLAGLGVPSSVLGCTTDTLTPVDHCRRIASLAAARYRELSLPGGHVWMLTEQAVFGSLMTFELPPIPVS